MFFMGEFHVVYILIKMLKKLKGKKSKNVD